VAFHVSKSRFAELVERAIESLPQRFREFIEEVPIEIKQRPSRKLLKSLGLEEDELLLGLYQGRAITARSVEDSGALPDAIYIFQEDVELSSDTEDQLVEQVRVTVLHELGHHFGLDEDDLDSLGYG
jgi:predicted Zn-dependent protease with MMP-like domain